MKKQITIRSLFMIVVFTLLSLSGISQVATGTKQDTLNARVSLIKNGVYRTDATIDTLAQSLRVVINSVDSNSVYSSRNNALITTNTASLAVIKQKQDTINQNLRVATSKQYVQRPSEKSGRTYKSGIITNTTATAISYTVTGGKTLYITSLTLSSINSNTTTIGQISVEDNTTVKIPVTLPISVPNTPNSVVYLQMDFLEPKQFSTNVNVTVIAGTINYSMSWTGYEE